MRVEQPIPNGKFIPIDQGKQAGLTPKQIAETKANWGQCNIGFQAGDMVIQNPEHLPEGFPLHD